MCGRTVPLAWWPQRAQRLAALAFLAISVWGCTSPPAASPAALPACVGGRRAPVGVARDADQLAAQRQWAKSAAPSARSRSAAFNLHLLQSWNPECRKFWVVALSTLCVALGTVASCRLSPRLVRAGGRAQRWVHCSNGAPIQCSVEVNSPLSPGRGGLGSRHRERAGPAHGKRAGHFAFWLERRRMVRAVYRARRRQYRSRRCARRSFARR
jgi:hypothetical protein